MTDDRRQDLYILAMELRQELSNKVPSRKHLAWLMSELTRLIEESNFPETGET